MADMRLICRNCGWSKKLKNAVEAGPISSRRKNTCPVTEDRPCRFDLIVTNTAE